VAAKPAEYSGQGMWVNPRRGGPREPLRGVKDRPGRSGIRHTLL